MNARYFLPIIIICYLSCCPIFVNGVSEITSINQNGNEITVSLTRPQQDDAILFVAVYDDVKLLNLALRTIIPSDNDDIVMEINIPPEATTIKAFVWNSFFSPLCDSGTFVIPPSNYTITIDDIYDRLDGSTVTIPLSQAIITEYFGLPYHTLNHNKTDAAIKNVIDGKKDLALVTYPSQENLDYAEQKDIELAIIPIVNDAFVFMVNNRNSIDSLAQDQIRAIYSGQITDWEELDGTINNWEEYAEMAKDLYFEAFGQVVGKDLPPPILPFQRQLTSGSQSGMVTFMGDTPISVPFHDSIEIGAMDLLIDRVTYFPNSMGYSYQYYANTMYLRDVKLLAIDGVVPTNENIENGTYPIITPYYAVFRADAAADSFPRVITELLLSPKGQEIAEDAGYVKLGTIPSLPEPGTYVRDVTKEFWIEDIINKIGLKYSPPSYYVIRDFPEAVVNRLYDENIASLLGSTNNSINSLVNGSIDIIIGDSLNEEELLYAQEQGVELEITPILGDAFGFIVHKDNPVNSLTKEQLLQIHLGEITDWSEVGGSAGEIVPFLNSIQSRVMTDQTFYSLIPQYWTLSNRWKWDGEAWSIDNMLDIENGISNSTKSFGEDLDTYKFLEIPDWDMNFEYYAITRKADSADSFAKRFVEHLLSSESQNLAEELGYTTID